MEFISEGDWELTVAFFLVGSVIGFGIIYAYRLIFGEKGSVELLSGLTTGGFGSSREEETSICPACHEVQRPSLSGCFKCGSPLENFSDWKWIPEKTETEA